MRLSTKQAIDLGILSKKDGAKLKKDLASKATEINKKIQSQAGPSAPSIIVEKDPQKIVFNALNRRVPDIAMYEVGGLVPGRNFRVDIYLPESRLCIEFDGFQYHKSKDAFQNDRDKRMQLVKRGYPVISLYYGQVKKDLESVVEDILEAHAFYKPFAPSFFDRHLEMALAANLQAGV